MFDSYGGAAGSFAGLVAGLIVGLVVGHGCDPAHLGTT